MGEFLAAIIDYNQSLKLNSQEPSTYYNRGIAYYQLKEYQKAIADYCEALKFNPNSPNIYFGRAVARRSRLDCYSCRKAEPGRARATTTNQIYFTFNGSPPT